MHNFYFNIASGSRGNCSLYVNNNTKILIDFGVSLRYLSQSLASIGVTIDEIDAILITHEHGDHIKGLETFAKKHKIPVYIPLDSSRVAASKVPSAVKLFKTFYPNEGFTIKNLEVESFATPHDSISSVGFKIISSNHTLSFATDIGFLTETIKNKLIGSDFVVLESNHDVIMLENGPYPYETKQRVLSNVGHLSNDDCANFVATLFLTGTKQVMLAHLSENNNTPSLAFNCHKRILDLHNIQTIDNLYIATTKGHRPIELMFKEL